MGSIGPTPSTTKSLVTPTDIDNLTSLLSGTTAEVRSPDHASYAASIKRWSSAAQKPAGLAVVPTTAAEVGIALKYASEHQLDVAVKGGGHSTAGVSSTDGGLLIDLGRMRGVKVDESRKLVYAQGGATWGDVDAESTKFGLATVGGTVADTGVGGLTLGGGYGYLSGRLGLVVDVLVEAEVVLADGRVVRCSDDVHADLFWALRGAGQNFGVTTEFVFKAVDQGPVWAGMLLFPPVPEVVERLVHATNDLFVPDEQGNTKVRGLASCGIALARPPPADGQAMVLLPIFFFGTEEQGKELFKPVLEIGPVVNTMEMVPYEKINALLAPPIGMRSSMKGAAFTMPLRPKFVNDVVQDYVQFTGSDEDFAGGMILYEIFDPKVVMGKEAGSYANRGWHLNAVVMPMWTKPEHDTTCRQWARDVSAMFKTELQAQGEKTGHGVEGGVGVRGGKGAVMLYGNYDQYDERSKDIFGYNYPELQKLKAKYDPGNMFNKLFAITPAT